MNNEDLNENEDLDTERDTFENTTYNRGFQDGVVSKEAKDYWFDKFEYLKPTKI